MILRKLYVSIILAFTFVAIGCGQNSLDSAGYYYGKYQEAISLGNFERSETFLLRILQGGFHLPNYNQGLVHNALGFVYYENGRLSEALEQYRLAEMLVSEPDNSSKQLRISIYINLDLYYKTLGDYTNALEYNNEAVRLLGQIPEWDERSYSKLSALLLNKGIALYQLGRYQEAQVVLLECAQIKKKHKHPYLGSVYFNLARVYQDLGDPALSKENYLKGIEQWSSEYDPGYYELANVYLHFGEFLTRGGEPALGLAYLQKALQNYKRNYGILHPLTAACYETLARHSLHQKEYEDALDYLQLALFSVTGDFQEKDPFANPLPESSRHDLTLLQILATKTEVLEAQSGSPPPPEKKSEYLEAALRTNLLSIEVLERIQSTFLSGESRVYLRSRQKDLFAAGIRLHLEIFDLSGQKKHVEEAFLLAAKGKSGELMFEMKVKEWLYLESLSDTSAIIATELKQEMEHLSSLIRAERMALDPDSAQLYSWEDQLFHTRDSFNRHMEQFRQEMPQITQFEEGNMDFTLDRVQRNLKRNETLVEYFLAGAGSSGREQLFIFVVTKNSCQVHRSTVDKRFHHRMEIIVEQLQNFVPYLETEERFDSLQLALFELYRDLVEPVEHLFRGNNLLIVPDEMLSFVPFDALITRLHSTSITNYAGISYLLKDYNISYMYNSQLIRRNMNRNWLFPEVLAWIPEQLTGEAYGYGKLRGAQDEIQEILEHARGRTVQKSMRKPEVAGLLQENSIIHLAMHSLARENRGSSPYFVLDTLTDPLLANRMYDYEINALDLSSPMVVLSSCETAGGRLQSGEGVMSLSRSFLQAGAASVVHTLWPVDDAKSREIMVGFYGEIKRGRPKSSALSRVKRAYLDQQPPFYTHPYYWAAIQITGDPSPLRNTKSVSSILGSFLIALFVWAYLKRRSFRSRA